MRHCGETGNENINDRDQKNTERHAIFDQFGSGTFRFALDVVTSFEDQKHGDCHLKCQRHYDQANSDAERVTFSIEFEQVSELIGIGRYKSDVH